MSRVMVKKRGNPERGELVVVKITKINPHSVFAKIEEYNRKGMIHISEVNRGWVKDIRKFVKMDQQRVAKVVRLDDVFGLSLKRVDKRQENERLKEYRLSSRAEKMLELVAKELGKSLDQAYEEVGYLLQENFGSLYRGFVVALTNTKQLKDRGVPEAWIEPLRQMAEKNIEQKEFEFRATLSITSYSPTGVKIIKKILAGAEKMGFAVHYVSAPEYLVKYKTKHAKKGQREFEEKLDQLEKTKEAIVTVAR